jgi:hypothetical protein
MKTIEELKTRIKQLGKQAAEYSHQAVQIFDTDPQQNRALMRQAHEASKRCQLLISEVMRREQQQLH